MARRSSPKVPSLSQTYETGCSSRLYRIFSFPEGQAIKTLVSHRRHSNVQGIGNGDSRRRPDVLTTVDEKYPHNHVNVAAVQGNKATNMVAARNFIKGKYICNDGPISQPHQFFDASQILYSNKELFLQLLQDQNPLVPNQIYNFKVSQMKEQYQAGQKMLTTSAYESRRINSQKNLASQCETPYAGCRRPLHSHGTYSYNAQTVKNLDFSFPHMRTKLRHIMGVRKKEQRKGTVDGMSRKFPGGDEAKGLEGVGRKSASNVHSGSTKAGKLSIDFNKREKMKIKDFMLCRGQGAVSVRESYGRNMTRTSVSPSKQNIQNKHVEAEKTVSEILKCRIEEQNNNEPPGDVVEIVKDELLCFRTPVTKSPHEFQTGSEKVIESCDDLHPGGIRNMDVPSDQDNRNMDSPTHSFDVDITSEGNGSIMGSPHDITDLSSSPEVASSSSSSSQTADDLINMRNTVDEHLSTESVNYKQVMREEVTNPPTLVSQPEELPIQEVHDNSEEHHFADLLATSSSDPVNNLFASTELSESDYIRELVQALSLKWDELVIKWRPPDQLLDPSTFEKLKGLSNQLSGSTLLFDCVIEVFMEVYQLFCRFPPHNSIMKPNVQAYVLKRRMVHDVKEFNDLHHHHHQHRSPRTLEQLVEKNLAKRGSWLDVQVDTEDIAIEVQEDILQTLILEIVSEMDTRSVINRYV